MRLTLPLIIKLYNFFPLRIQENHTAKKSQKYQMLCGPKILYSSQDIKMRNKQQDVTFSLIYSITESQGDIHASIEKH